MKKYEELTFADDFMFCKILSERPDLCKRLIEIILGKKVGDFVTTDKQKAVEITPNARSVRFDVYAEDDKNTIYDIEMQTTRQTDVAKRSRYYQGMIDMDTINHGARYRELKNCYIIFIMLEDPFGKGRSKYEFRNLCLEDKSLELGDEASKIFLNAGSSACDVSDELKSFLRFVAGSAPETRFTKELETEVAEAREYKRWRKEYMTLEMKFQEHEEKGRQIGKKEAYKFLAKRLLENKEDISNVRMYLGDGLSEEELDSIRREIENNPSGNRFIVDHTQNE